MKWKKNILKTLAVIVALTAAFVIFAVLLVKHSPSVRRTILGKVERYAEESTGMQLSIRDFKFDLSSLTLQLEGIEAHGQGAQSMLPLLQVERLAADIKVDSLLRGQWHLQSLTIRHPVIRLSRDNSSGGNSLQPQANPEASIGKIFDLAVQKCLIDSGEIYFNDVSSRLEAELNHLQVKAEFDRSRNSYQGDLGYDQGKLYYAGYAPVAHALSTRFVLTPTGLTVDKLTVKTGSSQVVVNGTLKDFTNPALQATYDAQLSTGEAARILKNASLPEGMVRATGSLRYENRGNSSFLQNIHVAGDVSSPALKIKIQTARTELRDFSAKYTLEQGNLEIQNIRAHALGGSANASLTIRDLAGASRSKLQTQLRDISLEQLESTSPQYSLPEANLKGKINADAQASWGRTLTDLVAHADATLTGNFGRPSAPLTGAVHLDYAAAHREIALRQSYVSTPGASLTLDGKLSHYSQLQVFARSTNLHQLELLAANLTTAFTGKTPQKLDASGSASFEGSATGSLTEPQIHGQIEARNLRIKGSSWKLLRANVEANPGMLSLSEGHLEAAPQGKIDFNLRTELKEWKYAPDSPATVNVSVAQIQLANVEWLEDYAHKVSGTLSGNLAAHGSQLNPVGRGEISLAGGKILAEPFQSISLKFQGDGKAVQARLQAHLPAGSAEAEVSFDPATQGYQAEIRATNIRLERLQTVKQRNQSIAGALNLNATGRGTISSPELNATADVSQLRVGDQSIQGVSLQAGIHGHVAEVTLKSEVAQTPFNGHGTVEITAPYMADIKIDAARVAFQPLLALYAPNLDGQVQGQAELHASLRGPLQKPERGPLQKPELLEGHIEIPVMNASYAQFQLGATKPLRADYKSGVLTLQPASLQGTGTHLQMQATIPVNDPTASTYLVEGAIDLSLAQMLQPSLTGSGQIQIELDSRKRKAGSDQIGQIRLVNASLHSADTPLGLDGGKGVLNITRNRMEIESMQGEVGGGTVSLRGGITFRPAIRFDLGMNGNNIRLRYPEGVRSLLESNLTFDGNKDAATLAGMVTVQNLSINRNFDLQNLAGNLHATEVTPSSSGFMQHVRLNINVQSASQMDVASSKLSVSGTANLHVVGTADEPVILGRASLNGGDIFLYGNRYVLENGAIDFVNPLRTEPIINAQIKTKIDQYDITLNLQGPMDRMTTTYTSEPPLPAADITNLLAFGHTGETATSNTLGNLGAQSILTQGLGAVSNRVEKFAGLSYFSIDPTLGGSDQNAGARVVIQERVTSNLVVTYSTDVTSTQRQAIQLEYRFNPRWSVSGVRDQNGGFGATANFHKDF